MGGQQPLRPNERQRIYQRKLEDKTLAEIAIELGRSVPGVRKWWRRGRDQGLAGLEDRQRGPHPSGILCRFDERVRQAALRLKRAHRRWGADRVLLELRQEPEVIGLKLPHRTRLSAFFKQECPECLARHHPRLGKPPAPPLATAVHEVWEVDNQEKVLLSDGCIATICNVRDAVGAAQIASQAFETQTARHWRKLDWTEIRQVLRNGFTEWETMPDAVLTDNELCLAGAPTDPFPSKLTLWLRGLGIVHHFIRPHCPTVQPHIERSHRTFDGFTFDDESRSSLHHLQQALDRERHLYNSCFPSRASDCNGLPPLSAHPELLHPRRPYQPDLEDILFDLQRIFDFLSTFSFVRHVSTCGVVSLGRILYSLGRPHAHTLVQVHCDPLQHEWVFALLNQHDHLVTDPDFARRPVKGLDFQALSGLAPSPVVSHQPLQLPLPFLAA